MDKKKLNAFGVVFSSWLAVFCLFGYRATFAVLKDPLRDSLQWTDTQVTSGYSLMMVIYALTAYASGIILDKWGSKPIYLIAGLLGGAGFFLTSIINQFWVYLLSFGFFGGIATGLLWVSSTVSVRKWFVGNKYATFCGIAFSGAPAAQFLLVFLTRKIMDSPNLTLEPWRLAMKILSIIIFIALFIAFGFAKKNPEKYNYSAFGSLKKESKTQLWTVQSAFRTKPIWLVIAMFLTSMMAEFLIWTQLISYWVRDLNWLPALAARSYGTIGIAGFFVMPLVGIFADRLVRRLKNETRARKLMLIIGPLLGICAGIILLLNRDYNLIVYISAILFAMYWAIVPGGVVGYAGSIYGRENLGKIWGLATLIVMGIGPFVGSFVGSFLYDSYNTYNYSIIFAILSFTASIIFSITLPLKIYSKNK